MNHDRSFKYLRRMLFFRHMSVLLWTFSNNESDIIQKRKQRAIKCLWILSYACAYTCTWSRCWHFFKYFFIAYHDRKHGIRQDVYWHRSMYYTKMWNGNNKINLMKCFSIQRWLVFRRKKWTKVNFIWNL
jgi:hypothetical protein